MESRIFVQYLSPDDIQRECVECAKLLQPPRIHSHTFSIYSHQMFQDWSIIDPGNRLEPYWILHLGSWFGARKPQELNAHVIVLLVDPSDRQNWVALWPNKLDSSLDTLIGATSDGSSVRYSKSLNTFVTGELSDDEYSIASPQEILDIVQEPPGNLIGKFAVGFCPLKPEATPTWTTL